MKKRLLELWEACLFRFFFFAQFLSISCNFCKEAYLRCRLQQPFFVSICWSNACFKHWNIVKNVCSLLLSLVSSLTDLNFFSFLQGDNQVYSLQHLTFSRILLPLFMSGSLMLMVTLLCPVSITTWWWPPQQQPQRLPQRTTTCSWTASCPIPLRCCGSSRAPRGAARWPPLTEAATVAAPAAWCLPAACGTTTKTESGTGTGTTSQDCPGPRWKLQRRRRPFMAPYLTLSLLTRSTQN